MISRLVVLGISIALLGPALVGCGGSPTTTPHTTASVSTNSPITGATRATRPQLIGRWQVIQVANVAVQYPERWDVNGNANLTFTASGEVHGTDATNGYDGHFVTSADGLHFTRVLSTLVGLLDDAPAYRKALQSAFLEILRTGKPVEARFNGTELTLVGGNYAIVLAPTAHG